MSDIHQTRSACEALSVTIAGVLEDSIEQAVAKPRAGLRGYGLSAEVLEQAGRQIVVLASAMRVLAASASSKSAKRKVTGDV